MPGAQLVNTTLDDVPAHKDRDDEPEFVVPAGTTIVVTKKKLTDERWLQVAKLTEPGQSTVSDHSQYDCQAEAWAATTDEDPSVEWALRHGLAGAQAFH